MTIDQVFDWIGSAANGGMAVLTDLAGGASNLFITTSDGTVAPTLLGVLAIAGVGAPLAWKFIKYIISLFKKVQPN